MLYVKEHPIARWNVFKEYIDKNILPSKDEFYFRGQSKYSWQLETAFDRKFKNYALPVKNDIESKLIENFKVECEKLEELSIYLSDKNYVLALAQHFGLPTRLLDWTHSPYIAAFFAFQEHFESGAVYSRKQDKVAVYVLNGNNPIWNVNNGVEVLKMTSKKNERLRNQAGVFTLSKTPFKTLEEFVEHNKVKNALTKISLPISEVKTAIKDLHLMGIKHSNLFPDLDGISKAAIFKTLMEY